MSTELHLLGDSALLALSLIFVAAMAKRSQEPKGWGAGSRDGAPLEYTGLAARLNRASANMLETFPVFAILILIANLAKLEDRLTLWGAELYFWGRLLYIPVYAAGIAYLRTLVWLVSLVGIILLFVAVL